MVTVVDGTGLASVLPSTTAKECVRYQSNPRISRVHWMEKNFSLTALFPFLELHNFLVCVS